MSAWQRQRRGGRPDEAAVPRRRPRRWAACISRVACDTAARSTEPRNAQHERPVWRSGLLALEETLSMEFVSIFRSPGPARSSWG